MRWPVSKRNYPSGCIATQEKRREKHPYRFKQAFWECARIINARRYSGKRDHKETVFLLTESATQLRHRLKTFGLSDPAIRAAWPRWWSDDAEGSQSAKAELRFSLSRKLGLDPHSLLDEGAPRFVWRDAARFKHLKGETELERSGITSFGVSLGGVLLGATESWRPVRGIMAAELRSALMDQRPFVTLADLLALCWSVGMPTVHLRVFPWPTKRMAAMAVQLAARSAILIGRDSEYPAQIAFYVAHEFAHLALGHIETGSAIVDLETSTWSDPEADPEEDAADRYALEILTGHERPIVLSAASGGGARALADAAMRASEELGIEPGTLALCFGYSTRHWAMANAAMKYIYAAPKPVWQEVNNVACDQLHLGNITDDSREFLLTTLGMDAEAQ